MPGESPVREALQEAEERWRNDPTLAATLQESQAFEAAEAAWLTALARFQSLFANPGANDRTAEIALGLAEREAARRFALAPVPTLLDLPRKLWLIEREASEVGHNNFCGKDLAVWLAAARLDVLRLLARPALPSAV